MGFRYDTFRELIRSGRVERDNLVRYSTATAQTFFMSSNDNHVGERFVQEAFHSYLKSSLAQAKTKGIIDADLYIAPSKVEHPAF
jgi:hypothetical protein